MATWVAALRSGKYKQGMASLHRDDKYCCLGVACDVYRKETKKGKWLSSPEHQGHVFRADNAGDERYGYLPRAVAAWFGMPKPITDDMDENDLSFEYRLTSLNDSGKSFAEIADVIEQHFSKGKFHG